jgi:serine/threonine-protein kinase
MSRKLGHYILFEELHRDWLGVCHAALDSVRGRRVSLRVLTSTGGEDAASLAALRHALRCGDDRIHANVAAVYEVGDAPFEAETNDGRACYVAGELLQGERLSVLLSNGLDARRVHLLMSQILLGLGCAHKLGMVHADLNPSNVLVQGGDQVRLLEVGLCSRTLLTGVDESTSAGWPMYRAPEQLLGETATVRSDLRAAGVLLYRMLAGSDPFPGSKALGLQKVLTEELPPVSKLKPDLGSQFDHVVAKATARRAEQRFQSAEEFWYALNRAAFDAPAAVIGTAVPAATAAAAATVAGGITMESGAQDRLAAALRDAVGPIAPILLRKALRESRSAEQCRATLAAQITESGARAAFLRATLDARIGAAATEVARPPVPGPPNVSLACGDWPLSVVHLQRLIARLSEEIGPIATLLVERAAARAESREEFTARMAELLPAGVMVTAFANAPS